MRYFVALVAASMALSGVVSAPLMAQGDPVRLVAAPGNAIPAPIQGQWGVRPEECSKHTREIYLVGQRTLK